MKKIFLEVAYDEDFLLYGIVSQEKAHRLAWLINKTMGYHLVMDEELTLYAGNDIQQSHMKFSFHDEINHLDVFLLNNRDESLVLMNELRTIDFFIIIKGALEFFKKRNFTAGIKTITEVQLISEIKHNKLKQRQNLIF